MRRWRVLLADEHTLVMGALAKLLAPECEIIGQVADRRMLMAVAERLKPDVIVLDIATPLLNGLAAAGHIKRTFPDIKLVFLTMYEDPYVVAEAFRAGASGYVLKRSA